MKKKILINGRFTSHHFAIRNVVFNITKELSAKDDLDVYVILNKDSDYKDFLNLNIKIILNPVKADNAILNHLYTIFILPFLLISKQFKLVVYPQICIYLFNPCKTILYINDLIEFYVESQRKIQLMFRKVSYPYICKHADHIMTISQNTKKDLIKIFNVVEKKITVAYIGYSDSIFPIAKKQAEEFIANKYEVKDFIFYIGYITHPQKNLIYLADEFVIAKKIFPNLSLVFAGPKGKDADMILNHITDIGLGGSFYYLGKIPSEDIKYLYSACRIFCFPSLYEGFGMPVLEAMACEAYVITSNVSSMPEIINDEDFLINPHIVGELSKKMIEILSGKANEQSPIKNRERAKMFTWASHVNALHQVINNLIR